MAKKKGNKLKYIIVALIFLVIGIFISAVVAASGVFASKPLFIFTVPTGSTCEAGLSHITTYCWNWQTMSNYACNSEDRMVISLNLGMLLTDCKIMGYGGSYIQCGCTVTSTTVY
jgi:hypothetical protein